MRCKFCDRNRPEAFKFVAFAISGVAGEPGFE